MSKIYRFPGSRPFSSEYQSVFFGRNKDIDELCKFINLEKLTVLYGKSGLGKSSLLTAGVVPKLTAEKKYLHLSARFGNYSPNVKMSPLDIFKLKIADPKVTENFLQKVENQNISLWQYIKSIELENKQHNGIFLVCDQFEELFTYPHGIDLFAEEFSELVNNKMPREFRKKMQRLLRENPELFSDSEIDFIEKEIDLNILISIRSDRLNLLNRLSKYVPSILNNCYELNPLSVEQAKEAIIFPAQIKSDVYHSPVFSYNENAVKKIVNFLTQNDTKPIETFQLQILCQHNETNIVLKNNKKQILPDDLGDMENIYKNYYDDLIETLGNEDDKKCARLFIEEGLIFEEEERRLSLYEGQISKLYNVTIQLLQKLVNTHLLRSEPNTSGGFSYEISHDTLVAPILKAKKLRKQEEFEQKEKERREIEIQQYKERQDKLLANQQEREKRYRFMTKLIILPIVALSILCFLLFGKYYNANNNFQNAEIERDKLAEQLEKVKKQKDSIENLANWLQDKYNYQTNSVVELTRNDKTSQIKIYKNLTTDNLLREEYKKLALWQEIYFDYLEKTNATNTEKTTALGDLALFKIFDKQFAEALLLAQKAYSLNNADWIKSNLALAYLVNNQYNKAEPIFLELKDKICKGDKTFKDFFLESFDKFEKININQPDFEKVKTLMKK